MQAILDALCTVGLYRKIRLIRNRYIRPELWDRSVRWRQFYSQFVSSGDFVFDIGANHGDRTEFFVQMGARVVAVEPIPSLATKLTAIFRYCPVKVEAVGVGSAQGTLPLRVCTTSECSSFSDDFIAAQSKIPGDFKWDRVETVAIVTVDMLIEKYGMPSFIKIDVEGFENEVLTGLTQPVGSLSFEVRPHDSEETVRSSLERLAGLAEYEFNLCLEENLTFVLPQWADGESVLAVLRQIPPSSWKYGDIYARYLKEHAQPSRGTRTPRSFTPGNR